MSFFWGTAVDTPHLIAIQVGNGDFFKNQFPVVFFGLHISPPIF
jgi:hypothetical protein